MKLTYIADDETDGKMIKHILKQKMGLSERMIKKLKNEQKILLNSNPAYVIVKVNKGDCIEALLDLEEEAETIIPEPIEIDILYEDDALVVINKQPGIVVHPTSTHLSGTIANALTYHLKSKGIEKKVRPVSRLDRDTSGIILFAKNPFVQEDLIRQMREKTFCKEYLGIAAGIVTEPKGTIRLPIDRKPDSIMLRHVTESGSASVTHFEVLEILPEATLLRFNLETGRTHQIRVHCQAIGHPLLGDTLYPFPTDTAYFQAVKELIEATGSTCPIPRLNYRGPDTAEPVINRQALHSSKVCFIHPQTRECLCISAPIPQDMLKALEILKNNSH